jgi:hypothetical protein
MIVPSSSGEILGVRSPRHGCRSSAHNVLPLCPPGAGKSMLARRLTTILPAMTLAEAMETTGMHSVPGLTGDRTTWVTTHPFRAPHQTISDAGLIGGVHVGYCHAFSLKWTIPWEMAPGQPRDAVEPRLCQRLQGCQLARGLGGPAARIRGL